MAQQVTVYRPTPEEWSRGLAAYVRDVVERDRGPRSGVALGLCKIVPPEERFWKSAAAEDTASVRTQCLLQRESEL